MKSVAYLLCDTATGEPVASGHIGEDQIASVDQPGRTTYIVPAECLTWPNITLDPLRLDLWAKVKADRDARIFGGVDVAGVGEIQTDADSKIKILGAVQMAQIALTASQPFAIKWTRTDNVDVDLDAAGMIGLGLAVGQYEAACFANGQALRAAINAATTVAELMSIDLQTGWPT